jgi:hypothetical protein
MAVDWSKANWRKASTSDSGGCVEVGYADGWVGVRDTKEHGEGPILAFTEHEWRAFLAGIGKGEFTLDALRS